MIYHKIYLGKADHPEIFNPEEIFRRDCPLNIDFLIIAGHLTPACVSLRSLVFIWGNSWYKVKNRRVSSADSEHHSLGLINFVNFTVKVTDVDGLAPFSKFFS